MSKDRLHSLERGSIKQHVVAMYVYACARFINSCSGDKVRVREPTDHRLRSQICNRFLGIYQDKVLYYLIEIQERNLVRHDGLVSYPCLMPTPLPYFVS